MPLLPVHALRLLALAGDLLLSQSGSTASTDQGAANSSVPGPSAAAAPAVTTAALTTDDVRLGRTLDVLVCIAEAAHEQVAAGVPPDLPPALIKEGPAGLDTVAQWSRAVVGASLRAFSAGAGASHFPTAQVLAQLA